MKMKKRMAYFIILVSLLLVYARPAVSDSLSDSSSFRCRGKIVNNRDTQYSVMKKCGKPTHEARSGNVWVYDFGPYRFVYYVIFVDGRVNRIKVGSQRR